MLTVREWIVFTLISWQFTSHLECFSIYPCKNSQRFLHIPFFSPSRPASPSDLRIQEMLLKQARVEASASMCVMIALGYRLLSPEVQKYLDQVVLPVVTEHLRINVRFRVQKCYALLLTSAQQVWEYHKFSITSDFTASIKPSLLALPTTSNWLDPRGRGSDLFQRHVESSSCAATFCWW